jgi:hypothetical protein
MAELITTVTPVAVGVNAADGTGESWSIVFDGTWRECDRPQVVLTDPGGNQSVIGFGETNSFTPTFLLTFRDKVYAACDTFLAFSAIGEPSQFQDRQVVGGEDADAPGNGYIVPGNNYGTPETIKAMAIYQNRMAVINRNSTQIWSMQPDPAANEQVQILENLGTFAPLSVQPMGTLDVMMLTDTGVRSLRVRDSSNSAIVVDVGTPVDWTIQQHLAELTEDEKATACAVVEPSSNRYWLFLPAGDTYVASIYVLSYFPSVNVSAWSTYLPTYRAAGVNTPFIPQKFVVKDGRVYARTTNGLIAYGGSDGNSYDACGMTVETPWMDAKTPATRKHSKAIDVSCQGNWAVSVGMDPYSGTLDSVYTRDNDTNAASFGLGQIPFYAQGTHLKFRLVEAGTDYARFSSIAFHFNQAEAN